VLPWARSILDASYSLTEAAACISFPFILWQKDVTPVGSTGEVQSIPKLPHPLLQPAVPGRAAAGQIQLHY